MSIRCAYTPVVGRAGMIGCKLLSATPSRVASLTMISTTIAGWNMALTMLRRPWITLRVRSPPLSSCWAWPSHRVLAWGFYKTENRPCACAAHPCLYAAGPHRWSWHGESEPREQTFCCWVVGVIHAGGAGPH